MKRLRRHQGMVTRGLGAGAVSLGTLEGLQIRSMKKQRKLAKEVTLNVLYKALLTIKKVCCMQLAFQKSQSKVF